MRMIVLASLLVAACGGSLPVPARGTHVSADFAEVDAAPPPPRAENISARPDPRARWVDGEWSWTGRRWSWRRGGWVIVPEGATFAPWATQIDASGKILFAPGTWRDARGAVVEAPATLGGRRWGRDAGPVEADAGPTELDAGAADADAGSSLADQDGGP